MLFLNNALASSMLPRPATFTARPLTEEQVKSLLAKKNDTIHCGNPQHAATWAALSTKLDIAWLKDAAGGKVKLNKGDSLLVCEINGLPRETREFTPEEINRAKFDFVLYEILG